MSDEEKKEFIYEDYGYSDSESACSHSYIASHVLKILNNLRPNRVIDLGCGNGSLTGLIADLYDVVGIDYSVSGVRLAQSHFEKAKFYVKSVYDNMSEELGVFDAVVSTEVIEHLYSPRLFLKNAHSLLRDGGHIVLSTPYHGYAKNLALALSGKLDSHFTALWDGGHIKFWSIKTISQVLEETGFKVIDVRRVGRINLLAKSMIIVAEKAN